MTLAMRRTVDGTLVIRPPAIVGRCAVCDVGILKGASIVRGPVKAFCSLACSDRWPAEVPEMVWWKPFGDDDFVEGPEQDGMTYRVRVDFPEWQDWGSP